MTPAARIEINGREVSTRLAGKDGGILESLTVTDEAGIKADAVEITIDDRDRYASAKKGDEIRVWLGYEPAPVYMGRFKIETVRKSGPRRTMTVSAKAAEFTSAIRAAKSRSWHGKTLGEIAAAVAAEHGLKPAVAASLAAVAIPHIDQQNESDVSFMNRLAARNGAVFKVADGRLLLTKKGEKTLPSGSSKAATTITPADAERWDWESTGRGAYKAVVCSYRDDGKGLRKTVTAGDKAAKSKHRDRRLYGSRGEAEQAARAQLGDFARGKVSCTLDAARGLPQAYADGEVVLEGFDAEVDATYRVKSVRHTLDGSGLRTSLTLEIGGDQTDPD